MHMNLFRWWSKGLLLWTVAHTDIASTVTDKARFVKCSIGMAPHSILKGVWTSMASQWALLRRQQYRWRPWWGHAASVLFRCVYDACEGFQKTGLVTGYFTGCGLSGCSAYHCFLSLAYGTCPLNLGGFFEIVITAYMYFCKLWKIMLQVFAFCSCDVYFTIYLLRSASFHSMSCLSLRVNFVWRCYYVNTGTCEVIQLHTRGLLKNYWRFRFYVVGSITTVHQLKYTWDLCHYVDSTYNVTPKR